MPPTDPESVRPGDLAVSRRGALGRAAGSPRQLARGVAHAFLLTSLLCVLAAPATAEDRLTTLAGEDADPAWEALQKIQQAKDSSTAPALLEAGILTMHPHIATGCGDTLRTLDVAAAWRALASNKKALKKLLEPKGEAKQRNLARVLGAWADARVDEPLAKLAQRGATPAVRVEALLACGDLGSTGTFPACDKAIKKSLKAKQDDVRAAACSAAGRRGLKDLTDDLESMVSRDKGEAAGMYAVRALGRLGWDKGVAGFAKGAGRFGNSKPQGRACLKAVVELSRPEDVAELQGLLKQGAPFLRDAGALAITRLVHLARDEAKDDAWKLPEPMQAVATGLVAQLIDMVEKDRSWEARDGARQALLALGPHARKLVQERMPAVMASGDADAELTAMELCGLFAAEGAYDRLLDVVRNDKDDVRRMFAARALEGVAPAKAAAAFAEDLKGKRTHKTRQEHAAIALGYIRHKDALETLLATLADPPKRKEVLPLIEDALERLTCHRFGRKPEVWRTWLTSTADPFARTLRKIDRKAARAKAVKESLYGLSPESERAMELGLQWLEREQHPLGAWALTTKVTPNVKFAASQLAYTGLGVLCFLGAGYGPAAGRYRAVASRALEYIQALQQFDGGTVINLKNSDSHGYVLSMATWGLLEGSAVTSTEGMAQAASRGVACLVRDQTPGGGWRYDRRPSTADSSVCGWGAMTLKSAEAAGLQVSQRSWDGVDRWFSRVAVFPEGQVEQLEDLSSDYDYEVGSRQRHMAGVAYMNPPSRVEPTSVSMTSVGMTTRLFMGWRRSHPFLIGCANRLTSFLPTLDSNSAVPANYPINRFYYWYYATLGMHQMGGEHWRKWSSHVMPLISESQETGPSVAERGSWGTPKKATHEDRHISTMLAVLSLQSFYRFAPQTEKAAPKDDEGSK